MIAFCHACNMTAFLGPRVSGWGDDSILSRMRNMTAFLGPRVSGWGDDSILSRIQHDCICSILEEHFRGLDVAMTLM